MSRYPSSPARAALSVAGLLFGLLGAPALAQTSSENAYEDASWTGKLQAAAPARKEAGAALVEGRRECARQGGDKTACLKKVQADYAAAMKRLQTDGGKR